MANITKSEFLKLYSDWEIKDFSNTDVELYKIFSGNCGEHFLVKSSLNGFVEIYRIKDDGTYELHETTEIAIKYLSDDDRKELENGVILYGKENLNSYIENLNIKIVLFKTRFLLLFFYNFLIYSAQFFFIYISFLIEFFEIHY